jgi:hypothetical protein
MSGRRDSSLKVNGFSLRGFKVNGGRGLELFALLLAEFLQLVRMLHRFFLLSDELGLILITLLDLNLENWTRRLAASSSRSSSVSSFSFLVAVVVVALLLCTTSRLRDAMINSNYHHRSPVRIWHAGVLWRRRRCCHRRPRKGPQAWLPPPSHDNFFNLFFCCRFIARSWLPPVYVGSYVQVEIQSTIVPKRRPAVEYCTTRKPALTPTSTLTAVPNIIEN